MLHNLLIKDGQLLRVSKILRRIAVGRWLWREGVKSSHYPKPIKLGSGITAWRIADIRALLCDDVA